MIQSRQTKSFIPYLLLLPAFLVLGYVLIYPAVYNIFLSLMDWRLTNPQNKAFVGLANYVRIFTDDETFFTVFGFTLFFTFVSIIVEVIIGLCIALLLNNGIRGRSIISALYLLPYTMAPIAVGLCWRLMWAQDYGLVNYLFSFFNIPKIAWLVGENTAVAAVIVPEVWRSVPFVTLMLLAGLTGIPNELYEAAKADGANHLQQFMAITFPLLVPSLTIVLIFETVFKLRLFDLIFTLTGGGPGSRTMPIGVYIYRNYFRYMEGGYSASLSVVLLLMGALISWIYIRFLYRDV